LIPDSPKIDLSPHFSSFFEFVKEERENPILVHCREGQSRSVSFLLAYAMKEKKMKLKEAWDRCTEAIPWEIRPNLGFQQQFIAVPLFLLLTFFFKG